MCFTEFSGNVGIQCGDDLNLAHYQKNWSKYITYLNEMTVWNTLLWIYAKAKIKLKICYQFYWDHVITAFWNDHWCIDNSLSCLLSFKLTQIRVNNVNIPIPFYILENYLLFSKMCLTKIISFIHLLHWTESHSLVFEEFLRWILSWWNPRPQSWKSSIPSFMFCIFKKKIFIYLSN